MPSIISNTKREGAQAAQEKCGLILIILGLITGCMIETPIAPYVNIIALTSAGFGALIFAMAAAQQKSTSFAFYTLPLILYGLYIITSPLFSSVPFFSLTSYPFYAAMPFCALLLLFNIDGLKAQGLFIARSLVFSFIPFAFWALYQFFFLADFYAYHASHPLPNSNSLAALTNVMILLSLALFMQNLKEGARAQTLLFAGLFVLYAATMIATGSRGGLLSILCALTAFFVMAFPSGKVKLIPSFGLGAIAYGLFIVMNKFASGQVSSLYHSALHGRSYNERQEIWQGAIALIKDAPLWGYGIGTYSAVLPPYRMAGDQSSGLNAHSDYLHMGVEIGVIGLALYAAVILYGGGLILRHIARQYLSPKTADNGELNLIITAGFGACVIALLLQGIVSALILTSSIGILIALCAAMVIGRLDTTFTLRPMGQKTARSAAAFILLLSMITPFVLPVLSQSYVKASEQELIKGNIDAFDEQLMTASSLSFYTNPFVYTASAEYPLSLLLANKGQIPAKDAKKLSDRAQALYQKALSLHPYMALPHYKLALLAQNSNDMKSYETELLKALELDGGFLPARQELAAFYKRTNRENEYIQTMRGGENWYYWRFSPLGYYSELMDIYNKTQVNQDIMNTLKDNIDNAQTRTKRGLTLRKWLPQAN